MEIGILSSEHIVIGAGLAGASVAWQLAERGEQVTIVERTTPANSQGSSHGSARIFRYAYPNQLYTDLVVKAKARWEDLERKSGRRLITPTGAVDHGVQRDPANLATVLERAGIEHELLSATEAQSRWPQFYFDTEVLWHPGAGVLDPYVTVETMLQLAEATGKVRRLDNWDAASVSRLPTGGFEVRSSTGESVTGARVFVAAGGWLPHLLDGLALPRGLVDSFPKLEVRQEQVVHMPYREANESAVVYPEWPTFIHKSPALQTYGLPGGYDANFRGQKLAQFNGGPVLPSALDQNGTIQSSLRERLIEYATMYLPGLAPEPYAEATCLFTNAPHNDFLIDDVDGVVIVSACSGHGAKFAPLLGELAVDLALGTGGVPKEFQFATAGWNGE